MKAEPSLTTFLKHIGAVIVWGILPLIMGLLLALTLVPRPEVGILRLDEDIDSYSYTYLAEQLAYASGRPQMRAVVLVVDSPGGTALHSEALYLDLLRFRESKPVVTFVETLAASGAYYAAVGTDFVYALPSSRVGSIGVVGFLPSRPKIYEDRIVTGPYKTWSSPQDTALRNMDIIKQAFYRAVALGRGAALQVGPEVVLRGEVWPGALATRYGLIDELGSQRDAIAKAAALAQVAQYRTVELNDVVHRANNAAPLWFESADAAPLAATDAVSVTAAMPSDGAVTRTPGLYLLYVEPEVGRLP